ncbi:MAG: hypothetical protein K2L87_04160 [Clostridiales bacterium]|nr:hypothetical protein [Clostridiales bacterium]
MKKFISVMFAAAVCSAAVLGGAACGEEPSTAPISVYAPDGAPALALANAVNECKGDAAYDFHIVSSNVIAQQVTGESPVADVCILPVNAASKTIGNGQVYQMLGTVTNGNMYFLSKTEGVTLTLKNLGATLIGKTVGVVQLTNVPGLTLQSVLKANNLAYQILTNNTAAAADKINLKPIQDPAAEVTPAGDCNYYLCPEPLASTKVAATKGKPVALHMAGDLQQLYGGSDGYPQAVLVAKKSLLEDKDANARIQKLIGYIAESGEYLENAEPQAVVDLLADKYTAGMTPSLNANNLTKTVIKNCSVRFTKSSDSKDKVVAFLRSLKEIDDTAVSEVADEFFYVE